MVSNGERQRAEEGLRAALDRLEEYINDPTAGDPLIPFAEALNWLYSLEEWHKEQLRAVGVPDYYTRRDNDPDGRVVAGVIYARGLVAHQLATAGRLAHGVFPSTFPSVFPGGLAWRWRPFSELPPPGKPETHGRDQKYRRYVEHEPVLTTMRATQRFFISTVPLYYA
jgi:hypothetical protein